MATISELNSKLQNGEISIKEYATALKKLLIVTNVDEHSLLRKEFEEGHEKNLASEHLVDQHEIYQTMVTEMSNSFAISKEDIKPLIPFTTEDIVPGLAVN